MAKGFERNNFREDAHWGSLVIISYECYPESSVVSPRDLANNGFKYIGDGTNDIVRCIFCNIIKQNWQEGEDVFEYHRNSSPECPIFQDKSILNGIGRIPNDCGQKFEFKNKDEHFKRKQGKGEIISSENIDQTYSELNMDERNSITDSSNLRLNPENQDSEENIEENSKFASYEDLESDNFEMLREVGASAFQNFENSSRNLKSSASISRDDEYGNDSMLPNSSDNATELEELQESENISNEFVGGNSNASINREQSMALRGINVPISATGRTLSDQLNQNSGFGVLENTGSYSPERRATSPLMNRSMTNDSNMEEIVSRSEVIESDNAPIRDDPQQQPVERVDLHNIIKNMDNNILMTPTYKELGINPPPTKIKFGAYQERLKTFDDWPKEDRPNQTPKEMAEAGFVYAEYSDNVACFSCGGKLRQWTQEDDPFIEHVRWFPNCIYIREKCGENFVNAVQELKQSKKPMTKKELNKILHCPEGDLGPLEEEIAVRVLVESGYDTEKVRRAAFSIRNYDEELTAEKILNVLRKNSDNAITDITPDTHSLEDSELKEMKEINSELRRQKMCKVCLCKPVKSVFLPCAHLVCCFDCSNSMESCPVCRKRITGTVMAVLK